MAVNIAVNLARKQASHLQSRRHQHIGGMCCQKFHSSSHAHTTAHGYQGFGSFFSPNFESMVRGAVTHVPSLDFDPHSFLPVIPQDLEFGSDETQALFMLDKSCTFLNHGAFGAVPECLFQIATAWRSLQEREPVQFFDRTLLPHLAISVQQMAKFLNCPPTQLALVPNATHGLNAVLYSYARTVLGPGKEVLTLDTAYGAVKTMLRELCVRTGATLREVKVPWPVHSEDEVVRAVANGLSDKTALAVFDHVTSNTALTMPVEKMAQTCKTGNIPVIVDGAHGLFALDLDLTDLEHQGIDCYITNCHKWFSAPKSCGVLWASDRVKGEVQPAIVSHGYGHGFLSAFSWDGCRDYSAALTIPSTLLFWNMLGLQRSRSYARDLALSASRLLSERWGAENWVTPPTMLGTMALVPLPDSFLSQYRPTGGFGSVHAHAVQDYLFRQAIEVPVKAIAGVLYVRISGHVYNRLEQYVKLADAVYDLQNGSDLPFPNLDSSPSRSK